MWLISCALGALYSAYLWKRNAAQVILVLNSGSSSLKFALFAIAGWKLISPVIYKAGYF